MRKGRPTLLKLLKDTPYCCAICGQGPEWNGKPLTLPIDHIDGNFKNNSPENLRFLCPHCHTQTETWGSKRLAQPRFTTKCIVCDTQIEGVKKKDLSKRKYCSRKCSFIGNMKEGRHKKWQEKQHTKIEWPNNEKLLEMIDMYNYTGCARILGVSDTAIRKRLKLDIK